jgi:hypothetical protein
LRSLTDVRPNDRIFAYETIPRAAPRMVELVPLQVSNNFAALRKSARQPVGAPTKKSGATPSGVCIL